MFTSFTEVPMPPKLLRYVAEHEAECTQCGVIKPRADFKKTPKQQMIWCKACSNASNFVRLSKDLRTYLCCKLSVIRGSAKKKGIPCTIDIEYLLGVWGQQNGKCFYSGIPLVYVQGAGKRDFSPSLDKIIPALGYVPGNVVFCTSLTNSVKTNLCLDDMRVYLHPHFYNKAVKHLQTYLPEALAVAQAA